jgi:hypothetical protein
LIGLRRAQTDGSFDFVQRDKWQRITLTCTTSMTTTSPAQQLWCTYGTTSQHKQVVSSHIASKTREQQWRVHVCIICISDYCTIRHNSLQKKEREWKTKIITIAMPPVPEMTTSDDIVGSNNQEPQQPNDDDIKLETVDLEKGIGGTTTSTSTARNGKYLRWARITKEVEIKEGNR